MNFSKYIRLMGIFAFFLTSLLVHSGDDEINALLTNTKKAMSSKEIFQQARKLPKQERLLFTVAGLELHGHYLETIKLLEPLLKDQRLKVKTQPVLTCFLIHAYIQTKKLTEASAFFKILSSGKLSELTQADTFSLKAVAEHQRVGPKMAPWYIEKTQNALKKLAPEQRYLTWHHRFIQRRLNSLKKPKASKPVDTTLFSIWLKADRSGKYEEYHKITELSPDSIYAQASIVEMARSLLHQGETRKCRKLLENQKLLDGPLGTQAQLLKGDALLLAGKPLRDAAKCYDKAIELLKKKFDIDAKTKNLITIKEALHSLDSSGTGSEWTPRPKGAILIPCLSPFNETFLRYHAVVRRSALAYAANSRETAITYARSLAMFDNVDRGMALKQSGAGGLVLAHTWKTGDFLFPISYLQKASSRTRTLLYIAVAYYRVYDWKTCGKFLNLTLSQRSLQGLPRDSALALLACIHENQDNNKLALEATAQVRRKKSAVSKAWFLCRQIEMSICLNQEPSDRKGAFAAMQKVIDGAPKSSPHTMRALDFQIYAALGFDRQLSQKLILKFMRDYPQPNIYKEDLQSLYKKLNKQGQNK